jgi:hypothetical protein
MLRVFSLVVAVVLLSAAAQAADLKFSWLPNSEPDLAGYKIHCGTAAGLHTKTVDVGKPATTAGRVYSGVSGLDEKTTYYCAATAYDTAGNSSAKSNEVVAVIGDLQPAAPGALRYEATFTGTITLVPIQ